MSGTGATVLKYWPVLVVAAGVIASASVDNFRITANADEINDISESVDENEEAIEEIELFLREQQGNVALDVQRLTTEQRQLGSTVEEIKQLLLQMQRERQ